jgi:hypothetical protein
MFHRTILSGKLTVAIPTKETDRYDENSVNHLLDCMDRLDHIHNEIMRCTKNLFFNGRTLLFLILQFGLVFFYMWEQTNWMVISIASLLMIIVGISMLVNTGKRRLMLSAESPHLAMIERLYNDCMKTRTTRDMLKNAERSDWIISTTIKSCRRKVYK